MALDIFEKYENSWRINHPDFVDVSRTPYAKGVITDFQIRNPLTSYYGLDAETADLLLAEAKVDLGGDYVPLFYHPKPQFWDGKDSSGEIIALATAFDTAGKYFKRAWQSFQVGDEVEVMLKEGTPIAIMAFADGKPRIGEDWVKVAGPMPDPVTLQPP